MPAVVTKVGEHNAQELCCSDEYARGGSFWKYGCKSAQFVPYRKQLSLPSVVLAEASWYGSIRTGWETSNNDDNSKSGVSNFASRWGIKGSSEASDGLTAVYRFEAGISDTANQSGRLSYVGLSGGFGTITVGQVWSASYNHFGGIVDKPFNYGAAGAPTYRTKNTVSYAVDVGSVSIQVDAQGNKGGG